MKRDISLYILLTGLILAPFTGCRKEHLVNESNNTASVHLDSATTTISFVTEYAVKAGADENITNATLLLFSENDSLSASYFIDKNENITIKTTAGYKTIVAIANAGNIIPEAGTALADFKRTRHIGITEESNQLIYSGEFRGHLNSHYNRVTIPLQSVMAKVSVIFDHTNLYPDVSIEITKIQLKNIPYKTSLFSPNRPESAEELIVEGDYITTNTNPAHYETATPLFIPENLQGNTLNDMCSFLEITALYNSSTKTGEVKYRSYFGEGDGYNIVRGVHYKSRVTFSGTGIGENSWRTETSGLTEVEPPFIYIEELYLYPDYLYFTNIGEQSSITIYYIPDNASFQQVVWVSDNPSVATVEYDGVVTATGAGETVLMAFADDASEVISNQVTVIVNPYIYVSSVEVILDTYIINGKGVNGMATAVVFPDNASNPSVIWSSSDPFVATIDENGVITSNNSGTCLIIATSSENSSILGEATLHVITEIPAESIILSHQEVVIEAGSYINITAQVLPADATNQNLSWSSDNTSVAVVSQDGTIYAISPGHCSITVYTTYNPSINSSLGVTVTSPYVPVTGVALSTNYVSLQAGESFSLQASVLPANASEKDIGWTSSNPSVATVCPSGEVTGISPGTTLITATSSNGEHSAYCTVDIFQPLGIYVSIHEIFSYNPVDESINSAEVILFARLGLDIPSDMNIVYSVVSDVSVNISYSYLVKGSVVNASAILTLDGVNNNDYPWISVGGSTATISLSFPLSEPEIIEAIASLSITVHPGSIYSGHYYITW